MKNKRPQLPTFDQINFDLDKKNDQELKNFSQSNNDNENSKKFEKYEKAKNYIETVNEIQNFHLLITNNSQLETLLKNTNSLIYYIDILKNLSNLSK